MIRYKLTEDGVIDRETHSAIPKDNKNADWREYLKWLEAGNTPEEQETVAEKRAIAKQRIKRQLDQHLANLQSVNGDLFDLAQAIYLVDQSAKGLNTKDNNTLDSLRSRFLKIAQIRQQYDSKLAEIETSPTPETIHMEVGDHA